VSETRTQANQNFPTPDDGMTRAAPYGPGARVNLSRFPHECRTDRAHHTRGTASSGRSRPLGGRITMSAAPAPISTMDACSPAQPSSLAFLSTEHAPPRPHRRDFRPAAPCGSPRYLDSCVHALVAAVDPGLDRAWHNRRSTVFSASMTSPCREQSA
jgi:hypothetical protein